uniref:Uncharacterized protein n=1 Tax=Rhizophora mucronata TaxID=61149 RepID=A0A2P2NJF9_RHIMU
MWSPDSQPGQSDVVALKLLHLQVCTQPFYYDIQLFWYVYPSLHTTATLQGQNLLSPVQKNI